MSSFFQELIKKLLALPFLVQLRNLLITLGLFDPSKSPNLIGMLAILLTREKLPLVIPLFFKGLFYGMDYVKTQHLRPDYYAKWLRAREHYDLGYIKNEIDHFSYKPIIAIVMKSRAANAVGCAPAVASIQRQFYPFWELGLEGEDFSQGSAPASDDVLGRVRGEFIIFMEEGDSLSPDALYEVVKLLNSHPEAEFIYSDEDKIGADGARFDPFFKPDWSPDLFLSMRYTGGLAVFRRATLMDLGGRRGRFGPAAAYDLVLRLLEKIRPAQIFHLPRILYHARSSPEARNQLPRAQAEQDFGRLALEDYRRRNLIPGAVQKGAQPGTFRLHRELTGSPKVAIIIPLRDKVQLLARCLTSILAKTDYPHYEILLVDNQSREPETLAYLQQMSQHRQIRTLAFDQAFNFSAINNFAVNQTAREYLLFLNNDTEIIAPGWLRAMLEHITREEVGVVGAKLLYPNRTVQHAGVVLGISGLCDHAYRYFPADDPGYFGQLQVVRNCSVVTGACLLTRKTLFQAVGGFEAQQLPVGFNDLDLCLKILEKDYLVVWTPYALLYHHEYASRGDDREAREKYIRFNAEKAYMKKKWGHYLDHDPYYNPNLTRLFTNYGF